MKEKVFYACSSPENDIKMKGGAAEMRRERKGITSSMGQMRVQLDSISANRRGDTCEINGEGLALRI